jgi:PKD repeat protein
LDLWSNDIEASKTIIAEYDGFMSPFSTRFYLSQLAPNGKIYINSSSGTNVLHVINSPNQPKELSDLRQHDIQLPTFNKFSLPNFPNYRLGALVGSLCDTLGINNHPLAGFTCEPESLTVTFSDNSYYAPTDWFWDFGDNGVSNEQNPIYSYSEEGTYEVCLTVSNDFDSDTFCKTVTVTTTNTKNLASDISFELYPNPTSDRVFVSVQSPTSQSLSLQITNLLGEVMTTVSLSSGMFNQEISLESFASGTYFYQLLGEEQVFDSGKLLLIK